MAIFDWVSRRVFNAVHRNNLVYNTCWEDPRLDRVALNLDSDDTVMVITSAGCNALDYVLAGPKHVYAVDMNPRQNALLDLKIAGIKRLEHDQFFEMFGNGRLPGAKQIYHDQLRSELPDWSRQFWDKKIKWFDHKKRSFYFRGTSGVFARMMGHYIDKIIRVRPAVTELLESKSIVEQRKIYDEKLYDKFWTGFVKFAMNRDTTLSMLGVPKAQRRQLESQYKGGIIQYVKDSVHAVFAELPISDNYFWRVYINGRYTRECCPEYLKAENFEKLKGGMIDNVSTTTNSVQGFLESHDEPISRFVLLDHMDWLSDHFFPLLEAEWQAIVNRAAPESRIIWRSGGLKTDFVNQVNVQHDGKPKKVIDMLTFNEDLVEELHPKDRVHTYASFYIADLSA